MGLDNHEFAKPGRSKWRVVSKGDNVFEVRDAEGQVYGVYASHSQAAGIAGIRQKQADARARKVVRPCMCCSKPFQSEGIHNRMCTVCRHHEGDGWNPYGLAPRNGRAK